VNTSEESNITEGICTACSGKLSGNELLDAIDTPVLLMQGNPRQVISANTKALRLFNKELQDIEGHRGGEVFNCVHSFTEAGCGKDVNCENCKIKNTIVDTFTMNQPHSGVSAPLQIRKPGGTTTCLLQVSTQKIGDLALVRVDRFENI
jgi:transcriptional regulator of aromatic amino acid metabolism